MEKESISKHAFNKITLDWRSKNYEEFPTSSGVYQLYGASPLYGVNTLLYIGKARNLKERIKFYFEKDNIIRRQPNVSCRYAEVAEELITVVEQILLVMHKPSFNSACLKNIHPDLKREYYYIQNHYERGLLNLEVTNFYFVNGQVAKENEQQFEMEISCD